MNSTPKQPQNVTDRIPGQSIKKLLIIFLGGIARKPRPIPAYRCSIDVTDLADIFTVDRPNQVRKKLKISAQTVEPFWRYGRHKCEGVGYTWYTFWSLTFQ